MAEPRSCGVWGELRSIRPVVVTSQLTPTVLSTARVIARPGMARLLTHDYSRMLDLAVSVLSRDSPEPPWQLIVDQLVDALGGTAAVLSEVHLSSGTGQVTAWTPGSLGSLPLDSVLHSHAQSGHPLLFHYATTGDRTPLAVTDLVDELTWRGSRAYALTHQTLRSRFHFAVPLPATAGSTRSFVVHRDGPDFTERERAYARRLQPLLVSVDAHFRCLRQWRGAGSASGAGTREDVRGALRLSPRETAVLVLLADALTAEAIAHRLGITVRTVHKHLQNLYRKLGTCDRLATVLRAQALGLLPEQGTTPL